MLSRFDRFRRYLRAHGARKTLGELGRRLRRLAYVHERVIVLIKDLDSIADGGSAGLRMEDLGAKHLPGLRELNRKRRDTSADRRFADYLEQGFHGFAAYRGEELVGYYWWVDREAAAQFPDLREKGLGIELDERDVYGSDLFLLEEHRGGGAAGAFLSHIESSLRDRGYRRIWGYVVSDNRPARWIYSTRGYEPMWIVDSRRVGVFTHTTREPLS